MQASFRLTCDRFQITHISMKNGKVYLVGAGPGDVGLITVKGRQLLETADVVMYDALICPEILSVVRNDAELIQVGKRAGKHTLPQEQIDQLIVDKAKQGKMVIRLKGGDPYVFGRGGEEALSCAENNIDFEVVPGVTSPFAASAYAGIPVTHRDLAASIAVVTGHRKADDSTPIEIPKADTVIFLMSVTNIELIIDTLIADGWSKDTPIAAIEHGTWYDQRTISGTLDNFMQVINDTPLRTPAIFIVGKVVNMRQHLDWLAKKPRILTVGTHPDKYRHLGTIVSRQLIECVETDDYSQADEQISHLDKFDWLIFTSANGIRFFFARLYEKGLDSRSLAGIKIAVIGKVTENALAEFGIKADLCAKTESSPGLLNEFSTIDLKGAKILLAQAETASETLPVSLTEMNANVTKIAVYKTIEIECDDVDFDYIDQVLFTSGSSVRAFLKRFGSLPSHVKALCLGTPTQTIAKEHGIDAEIIQKD